MEYLNKTRILRLTAPSIIGQCTNLLNWTYPDSNSGERIVKNNKCLGKVFKMSYRPDDQQIEIHIDKILDGIQEFQKSMRNRFASNEWNDDHLERLELISNLLHPCVVPLMQMKNETW